MGHFNPNVAKGGGSADALQTVPNKPTTITKGMNKGSYSASANYSSSNSNAAKPKHFIAGGVTIKAQASTKANGSCPQFTRLQPKHISTNPGKMGTNYKP